MLITLTNHRQVSHWEKETNHC